MKPSNNSKLWKYLQDYRFNSILVKSFAIVLAFLLLTFTIIMSAVSGRMNQIIIEEVGTMSENSLGKTRDRIDVVMEEVARISGNLALDNDVRKFMLPSSGELFGVSQTLEVQKKIEMYAGVFDYIDSIYVFSNKNKYIISGEDGQKIDDFTDKNWLENLLEREYEPARMISRAKDDSYPNLISYIQPIRLTQMQFLGGIIVNIDSGQLAELIVSNVKDSSESLYIADARDNIIYSSDSNLLRKKLSDIKEYEDKSFTSEDGHRIIGAGEEEKIITIASSNKFQWKYVSTVSMSAYETHQNSINQFRIILYILSIALSVIAAFVISIYCYNPVKSILDLLKNPDIYDEEISMDSGFKKNETHEITLNIIRNLYTNQQMQRDMKKYSNIIDKAQLTALQAQISPHFLYNTLENIRWRAIGLGKGDNEVAESILYLSEMLRNSLDIDEQIISVQREVKSAKIYVKILQLRYGDRLKVIWEIDPVVQKCAIVKISLQPIIENAVYHGIKPLRKEGIICIKAVQKENTLVITVKDNGVGMKPEVVARLNEDMQDKYILKENNIGIRNVNQRIRLLLGDGAMIKIVSLQGEGTTVTMILPLQYTNEPVEIGREDETKETRTLL
ncbi:MAG: sensor histidine kinase [Lachnospiraceae bacterium]